MKRQEHNTTGVIILSIVLTALLSYSTLFAESKSRSYQMMGRVSECRSGYIKIGNTLLYLTPGTKISSQTKEKINISEIDRRGLVYVSFQRFGKRLVAAQIKLFDLASASKQQSFKGKIEAVGGNRFSLDGKIFHYDEFTIRMGDTVQKRSSQGWLGASVIVVAIEKEADIWVAEFIREDFETTAMVE